MVKNKSKIKKVVKITFEIVVISLIFLSHFLRNEDIIFLSDFSAVVTAIAIILIMYAIFILWIDDFFKKKWRERDYRPLIAIVLAIVVLCTTSRMTPTAEDLHKKYLKELQEKSGQQQE